MDCRNKDAYKQNCFLALLILYCAVAVSFAVHLEAEGGRGRSFGDSMFVPFFSARLRQAALRQSGLTLLASPFGQ